MNPIYKFQLGIGADVRQAFPVWGNDLAKEFALESGEQFFRAKLSGKLTFTGNDYARIVSAAFDTQFLLEIFISYDGTTWSSYWKGTFWKTDCVIDADAGNVVVTPSVSDQYNDILAGLDKEYNLIDLAPEIVPVKYDKRPMIQIYVPGQTVVGCFLSGMWWEQECEAVDETDIGDYYFTLNKSQRSVEVSGSISEPGAKGLYMGEPSAGNYSYSNGTFTFRFTLSSGPGYGIWTWEIVRNWNSAVLWRYRYQGTTPPSLTGTITMNPVAGSGVTGVATAYIKDVNVYARYVLDVPTLGDVPTHEIPQDDLVPDNRNYKRCLGYDLENVIAFSGRLTGTPTKWGLCQPGLYYQEPAALDTEFFPVARSAWSQMSIWFAFSSIDTFVEEEGRASYTLRDAYPLASVISVLLGKIAPGITHQGNTDYSEFLYGTNPVTYISQTLLITPKSNVISSGYDQPAQKAPITLKTVLDMLRDCFRCYWFVDSNNRFRIEHISYFMRGGAYSGSPSVGTDLTTQQVTRNGKAWAFGRNQYQFDKPEMAARYQFGWMDDVTELFEGYPIDILSGFVNPDNIEQITVNQFTSDIDYVLLNPGAISPDGFVLLGAVLQSGQYVLPYYDFGDSDTHRILQNAYLAFIYLQRYYAYDMPAYNYEINGVPGYAIGVKKLKKQTIEFPAISDPDLFRLIRTNVGDGMIEKISINLSSRNAQTTLKYDTE